MSLESLIGSEAFKWVILPLLIFLARLSDVSLGTIRISFVSRGFKYLASLVGFFEVMIWLLAIRVIMQNLDNVVCYLAYGAGFSMGTFVGINIEKRMAIGTSIIRIITQRDASELINRLRAEGFGVTNLQASGRDGLVHVIFLSVKRSNIEDILELIRQYNPKAFFTIEESSSVSEGIFPMKQNRISMPPLLGPFRFWRKGK